MQVGSAYGTTGDFDNRIARILEMRVGNGIAANVFLAMPNEGFHLHTSNRLWGVALQSRCPAVRLQPDRRLRFRSDSNPSSGASTMRTRLMTMAALVMTGALTMSAQTPQRPPDPQDTTQRKQGDTTQ